MKTYDPANWFWMVGGDASRVYSSAAGNYVQSTDPAYLAWSSDGTPPTQVATAADLGEVLAQYSLRPADSGVLDGYQDTQSRQLTIQVVAKVLLWCVNEIRVLKGQQPVTAAGFRTFLKGLM